MINISLNSINAADPAPLKVGDRVRRTGHYKQPAVAPVKIEAEGVAGDFIGNHTHHGGVDQALYLYALTDNLWWARLFGHEVPPGFFGENLTLDQWWPRPRVGDRLRCGEVLLELTGPRTPCATLEARAGVRGLSREFVKAERCGAYARVLQAGNLSPGDQCEIIAAPAEFPEITEVFRYWHAKGDDVDFLQRALAAPLAVRIADVFRSRLARCQSAQTT